MIDATSRVYSLLLIAITAAILLASFYFEFVLGLNPCPLCLMQRFCVMLMLPCTMISYYSKQEHFLRWALRIQLVVAGAGVFLRVDKFGYNCYLWNKSLCVCLG